VFSKEFVPLFEALAWISFWSIILLGFRKPLLRIVDALISRVKSGSKVTLGPVTLGEPPESLINEGPTSVAVSDKEEKPRLQSDVDHNTIRNQYNGLKKEYFMLHASEVLNPRTSPMSPSVPI
jgi:hypothetical protein